jgi:hypothetical protein
MIDLRKKDDMIAAIEQILQQEALKGNQHLIDKNKNNKVDPEDFKILRGEKKTVKEEETVDEGIKELAKKAFKAVTGGSDEDQRKDLQRKMGLPQTGKKPTPQKEEVEQIDELSKSTLGSYVKKANDSTKNAAMNLGYKAGRKEGGSEFISTITKRRTGIEKASDKLAKEEVEQIDEVQDINDPLDPNRMDNRNRSVKRNIQARLGQDERGDARVRAGQERSTHMRNKPQLPEEVQGKTLKQFRENAFDWKKKPEPTPNGGSGVKQGSRYGGSKQKDKPEQETDEKK